MHLWTTDEFQTTPLAHVRAIVRNDLRREHNHTMIAKLFPVLLILGTGAGFALFLDPHFAEILITAIVTGVASLGVQELRLRYRRQRDVREDEHRDAAIDLDERKRIDARFDTFIESMRTFYTQQCTNLQTLIDTQKGIIHTQEELMALKTAQITASDKQISDLQNQVIIAQTQTPVKIERKK